MARIRRIHPSATVFVGILIALILPFGHAVESCSPENADFTGVELLAQDVEGSSEEFAEETEANGAPFAWALLLTALLGLTLAAFRRGALWGTLCFLAWCWTSLLALAVNMNDPHIGCHVAFWLSTAGFVMRLSAAVRGRFAQPAKPAGVSVRPSRPSSRA